jgi:hypothetical protein
LSKVEENQYYRIIITLKSGTEVESIDFRGYPPTDAITAGMRLYGGVKWRVEELEDEEEL